MSVSARYASYIHQASFDELPAEVREMAKNIVLDTLGCALGALQTDEGRANVQLADSWPAPAEATVMGTGKKVPLEKAAFLNAQLANLLDFDDTFDIYEPGHPGCRIVPAALATGEFVQASGRELLLAIVLAYEISLRIGRSLGSVLWTMGHPRLPNPAGPAVAAARLLGQNEALCRNTLDVLTLEAGLDPRPMTRIKQDVPPSRRMGTIKGNMGQAAELGILAARKAQAGLTGMRGLLDVDYTTWFMLGLPEDGHDDLTQGLDAGAREHWIHKVSFKPTPSCRWTHAPITAAWNALGGQQVKLSQIDRVVVKGVNRLQRPRWQEMIEAQFSTPCALALALSGETPGPAWYRDGRFRDADIRGLASKVEFVRDPAAEAAEIRHVRMTCAVEIKLKKALGKSGRCDAVKGAPDNPMDRTELIAKFEANTSHLPGERRQALLDTILNLDQLADVTTLAALL